MKKEKEENNQLVEVIKDNQLSTELSGDLSNSFEGLINEAKSIILESKKIIIDNDSQVDDMKLARKNRLLLVGIRGRTEKIRVSAKENIIREGKAVDGASNIIKALTIPEEKELLAKERYIEDKKEKELIALEERRSTELLFVECDPSAFNLQIMSEKTYQQQLKMATDYYFKIKAQEKADQAQKIENEKIEKLSNERLRAIIEVASFMTDEEKEYNLGEIEESVFNKLKNTLDKREKTERKNQEKQAAENKKLRDNQKKKEKAAAAKLKIEKDKAKIIQDELDAKNEEERKDKQKIKDDEKKKAKEDRQLLLAPDKEKLNKLAIEITSMEMPNVKDKVAKKIIEQTIELLAKTSNYIKVNAVKL